jgi:hypothetical protein
MELRRKFHWTYTSSPALVMITAKGERGQRKIGGASKITRPKVPG